MTRLPLAILAMLLLSACAYVGGPQAPTLDIPQTVGDLRVGEFGDHIRIEFTMGAETTEGLPLRGLRLLEVRIGPSPQPWDESKWAASAKSYPIPYTAPGPVAFDKLPVSEWVGKEVVIRVRAVGPKGKASQWSNLKTLAIEPALAAPADLKVDNQPRGLILTWKSSAAKFRVFRKGEGDEMPAVLVDNDASPNFEDQNVEFGKPYVYYVQAFEDDAHQSELAVTPSTARLDIFTPSVPAGLVTEPGSNSIELSWDRNTEARFQGYNVYRSVEGGPFEKIASLIIAPAYSDRKVESGRKYRYSISAVGTNGKESDRSAPVEASAQ